MSLKTRRWSSLFGSSKSTEAARQEARKRRGMRKLFMEPLEDRRLLAHNVIISTAATSGGSWSGGVFTPTADDANVQISDLVSKLTSNPSVTINTGATGSQRGGVTLQDNLDFNGIGSGKTLTLQAADIVKLVGSISDSSSGGDGLNLVFDADSDSNGSGIVLVENSIGTIGTISFQDSTAILGTSAVTIASGGQNISVTGGVVVANSNGVTINSSGGNISVSQTIDSGNEYQFVSGAVNYHTALTNARNDVNSDGDRADVGDSYLVTITSAVENSIVAGTAGYVPSWFGGSDEATEGDWKWMDGPEQGQTYWVASGAGTGTAYGFVGWGSGEPNGGTNVPTSDYMWAYTAAFIWDDVQDGAHPYVKETNLAPTSLALNAGAGGVTVGGNIGSGKPLQNLTITAGTLSATGIGLDGTLSVTNSGVGSITGVIAGPASVTKAGAGTLTLSGANTYNGSTIVSNGKLVVTGSITSNVTVSNPGILAGTGNGTTTGKITGNVSGTGTLAAGNSPGLLTIVGNLGPIGTLDFEVNGYGTPGTDFDRINVTGGVNLAGATLNFSGTDGSPSPTYITIIDNNGTGDATSTDGSTTPANNGTVTINGHNFKIFYNSGDGNDVILADDDPTIVYVDDSFAGGPGTVIADADLGTTGNQTAVLGTTAFTTINGGLSAVSSSGTVVVNGGTYAETVSVAGTRTLRITGPNAAQAVTIEDLASVAGTTINIQGSSSLTAGDADNRTVAGSISGSGSLTKQGGGTLTLSGANTYAGTTTISQGTLLVDGTNSGTGAVSVDSGGTLGGSGSIGGTVTVNAGGIITGATASTVGTLTVGGLSFNGGKYHADLFGNTSDRISTGGAINLAAPTQGQFELNVLGGATSDGTVFRLINNTHASNPISNQFSGVAEGAPVTINGKNAAYTYAGGPGANDFTISVLTVGGIFVTGTPGADNFRVVQTATNIDIYTGGTISVSGGVISWSGGSVTGYPLGTYVAIDGNGGSDNLMVDYAASTGLEDVNVLFQGGGSATNSGLYVSGGTFGKVVYDYIDANNGLIENYDAAGTSLRSLIFYFGLAPITNTGTVTDIVFNLPGSGNVQAILEDAPPAADGLTRLRSNPVAFEQTDFANPSGSVTINRGSVTDDLTVNAVPDFTAGLTIGSGANPFDQLTVAGAVTLADNKNMTADATTISFSTTSSDVTLAGSGAATLTAVQSIAMGSGSSLTSANGNLTLSANAAGTAAGPSVGIDVVGGTVQATGSGAVSLTGKAPGAGTTMHGVAITAGGKVQSDSGAVQVAGTGNQGAGILLDGSGTLVQSTTGAITLTGQSNSKEGIEIIASATLETTSATDGQGNIQLVGQGSTGVSVSNGIVRTVAGDIQVTGTASAENGIAVFLDSVIQTTGSGDITMNGTSGTNALSHGISVGNFSSTSLEISTVNGDIALTGSSTTGNGVQFTEGEIKSSGNGDVALVGTATTAHGRTGVSVSGPVSSNSGNLTITGTAGDAAGRFGVELFSGPVTTGAGTILIDGKKSSPGGLNGDVRLNSPVTSSGANITIRSDRDVVGDATGDISTGAAVGGNIFITADQDGVGSPNDAGTIQTVGNVTAGTGNITLSLTDCDGNMTGNITSGANLVKNGSGALRLSGLANTYTGTTTVNGGYLLVNGVLNQSAVSIYGSNGGTFGGTGTINATTFTVDATGRVDPGECVLAGGTCSPQPGILIVNGNVKFNQGATFNVQLNGVTAGTGYDQLQVNGTVDLTGTVAGASGSLLTGTSSGLPIGAELRIIDNNDADLIGTRFNGLPEGSFLNTFGQLMNISYYAGTGNDVELTVPGRFDFNGGDDTTAPNYVGVLESDLKTGSNSYGWDAPVNSFTRPENPAPPHPTVDPLLMDGHWVVQGTVRTFQVSVVPGTTYQVQILTGDWVHPRDYEQFRVYDPGNPTSPADSPSDQTKMISTQGDVSEYLTLRFEVTVGASGLLYIEMQDRDLAPPGDETDAVTVILGMDIRPIDTVGAITLNRIVGGNPQPNVPLSADGMSVDTYRGEGAPPGALLTVRAANWNEYVTNGDDVDAANLGMITTADEDQYRVYTQVYAQGPADPNPGRFEFQLQRPTGAGPVLFVVEPAAGTHVVPATGTGQVLPDGDRFSVSRGTYTQAYALPETRLLDFNGFSQDTATGYPGTLLGPENLAENYLGVSAAQTYDLPTTNAFGWNAASAPLSDLERTGADPLLRDGHYGRDAEFYVDLPAGGTYLVNTVMGDAAAYAHDQVQVYLEGALRTTVSTTAGQWTSSTFEVVVAGAPLPEPRLDLRLVDAGGTDPVWVLNALRVRPLPATRMGLTAPSPSAALDADGQTEDTFSGSNAPANSLLTVSTTVGTIVSPDVNGTYQGVQVQANAAGQFSFKIRRPQGIGGGATANIKVEEVLGRDVATTTQAYQLVAAPATVLKFDFGQSSAVTQTGYTYVDRSHTYNATRGFGWSQTVGRVDRYLPSNFSNLNRDLHYSGVDATFRVRVGAAGPYNVRVYLANPLGTGGTPYRYGNFGVTVEGTAQQIVTSVAPGTIGMLTFSGGNPGGDGILEIAFDSILNSTWIVSGMEITTGTLPTAINYLTADEAAPSPGGVTIDDAMLAPLVSQAAARWTATGLTAAQAAVLADLHVGVGDLGGSTLGMALSTTNDIRIDDDAAGWGWSVGSGQWSAVSSQWSGFSGHGAEDSFLTPESRTLNPGLDLMHALMHEIGHLLGYEHREDGLMAPRLSASSSRLSSASAESVEPLGQPQWRTGVSFFDLATSRRADDVFAKWGEEADSQDDTAPELLESKGDVVLAAATARSSDQATQAKVPRRSRLHRYERDVDAWFAELTAEEAGQ